jgi:thiamine-phosphate pyrophosphorylase
VSGLQPPVICLVTGRARYRAGTLVPAIAAAAAAGIDLVQVREPGLPDRDLLALVQAAVTATAGTRARVVVNDRLDVALAAGAAGVHLRADSVPSGEVRRLAPQRFLIGRSVHTRDEAEAEADRGASDYLVFGTILPSGSKPPGHPPVGFEVLVDVCRAVRLPVLAIGGLSEADAGAVARAGAGGLAAIGLFAASADVAASVAALRGGFDTRSPVV